MQLSLPLTQEFVSLKLSSGQTKEMAAKCHEKDLYNKQVGRMKSSGRLLSERYYQEAPEIDETTFIKQTKDGYVTQFNE